MASRASGRYRTGAMLSRLRRECGFSSARGFFQDSGGRAFFGCTYSQYLNVEQGRSIPSPLFIERCLGTLRLGSSPERARPLLKTYLLEMLEGREELVRFLEEALRPSSAHGAGEDSPLRRATRQLELERIVPLSQAQVDVMLLSVAHFACFRVFSEDSGDWGAGELAALLRYPASRIRAALKDLHRAGLLAKASRDRYRCFDTRPSRVFTWPRGKLLPLGPPGRLGEYLDEMERRGGGPEWYKNVIFRASPERLRGYLPFLENAVTGSLVYTEPDGPAILAVEARVRRLLTMKPAENGRD